MGVEYGSTDSLSLKQSRWYKCIKRNTIHWPWILQQADLKCCNNNAVNTGSHSVSEAKGTNTTWMHQGHERTWSTPILGKWGCPSHRNDLIILMEQTQVKEGTKLPGLLGGGSGTGTGIVWSLLALQRGPPLLQLQLFNRMTLAWEFPSSSVQI